LFIMSQDSRSPENRLLAVDVGNSLVHLGVYEEERLVAERNVPTGEVTLRKAKNLLPKADAFVISSVVPSVTLILQRISLELGTRALVVDHTIDLGIELDVEEPSQVGADRLCNAVAAHCAYGSPAIVIDFGTAITFDVLQTGGVYAGGVIIPGALLQAEVLARKTAKLPLVDVRKPADVLGKNTVEAIRAGVFYGSIGGVRFVCERLRKELDRARPILTGGGLELFGEELGIKGIHDPHLTLRGLRLIYERN
jgi:type III pantothenate kinase